MKIYQDLLDKNTKLGIIGLGYVGLPIALEFAKRISVIGFDINPRRIEMMRNGIDPQSGFMLITSRASYEMIEKTARFGASTLVAISAPTSLAVERAEVLGIALYAIARADGAMKFTHLADELSKETRP